MYLVSKLKSSFHYLYSFCLNSHLFIDFSKILGKNKIIILTVGKDFSKQFY